MNIVVKTPIQNSYFTNIPFYLNPLFPTEEKISLHDVPSWVWYKNYTYEQIPEGTFYEPPFDTVPYKNSPIVGGECVLNGFDMSVKTFDGNFRHATSLTKYLKNSCNLLISKDCQNERLFSISSVLLSETKMLAKILIPNNEVEVEDLNGRISVRVNGIEKFVRPSEPVEITQDYSEPSHKVIKIERFDSSRIELKFYEIGAKVSFDGEMKILKIKLAPWSTLQGDLCGICGNYNLDQSDDYTTAETLNMPSSRTYFESYVLPSQTCDVDRIYNTDDETCVTEDYLTTDRYDDGTPMTCRSEKKVIQCVPGCRPVQLESVKTCFTCTSETGYTLPRKTYYTPRWEDESGVECSDFYQRVEVPTRCVPVY